MVFLSHSWKNKKIARKVVEALCQNKVPCWIDEQQLTSGLKLGPSLKYSISKCRVLLYLISSSSNESAWCQEELNSALELEQHGKINIIPVKLEGNEDPLPDILEDRIYSNLDPSVGGAGRLAHELASREGVFDIPTDCRLTMTIRLEKHRIVHTLNQFRNQELDDEQFSLMLIDKQYNAVDDLYWKVAEVQFGETNDKPDDRRYAENTVDSIHARARNIITEVKNICSRLFSKDVNEFRGYYDQGYERALFLLLHNLQWYTTYLGYIRDRVHFGQDFLESKNPPDFFDGHHCDFAIDGYKLGIARVPKYGHPYSSGIEEIFPWGMTSPFTDIPESEVGIALGEALARMFIAGTVKSVKLPNPESLAYGLS